MQLVGANQAARPAGRDELAGRVSYFNGSDRSKWRTDVETFERVAFSDVYPGIDMVYYGNQRELEYDFVVAPGRDASAIALNFDGADTAAIEVETGDMLLTVGGSTIRQKKPFSYQESNGTRVEVESRYVARDDGTIGFEVGEYDPTRPLTIDPVLTYSTYLGGGNSDVVGSFDYDRVIAVDSAGNAYIAGETASADFPTTVGSFDIGANGGRDVFVTKLNPAGTALVYSTFIGGSAGESAFSVAIDGSGNAYLTGETASDNFPTTVGAFDTTRSGTDAFVTKLDATGSVLLYSTFLGGSGDDFGVGIAADSSGNAYVAGYTPSTNFPTTTGAFDTSYNLGGDLFMTKVNPTGSALVYSTYVGGSSEELPTGLAVDSAGNAFIAGETLSANFPTTTGAFDTGFGGNADGFVTKINPAGTALVYSTFLGGTADDSIQSIAIDGVGSAYVAGLTGSTNFPVSANPYDATYNGGMTDAFASKLDASGAALAFSTYLGGALDETAHGIAVDSSLRAHVTGTTASTNFPVTSDGYDTSANGDTDAFLATFDAAGGALFYSTYFGGASVDSGSGIAIGPSGDVFLAGFTLSSNFPTTAGAFDTTYAFFDVFIARFGSFEGQPTTATVQGQVTNPNGGAVRNAIVKLTDAQGVVRTNLTNTFGFYTFTNVATGQTYTLSVNSNRYRFANQQQLITGDTTINFVGLE